MSTQPPGSSRRRRIAGERRGRTTGEPASTPPQGASAPVSFTKTEPTRTRPTRTGPTGTGPTGTGPIETRATGTGPSETKAPAKPTKTKAKVKKPAGSPTRTPAEKSTTASATPERTRKAGWWGSRTSLLVLGGLLVVLLLLTGLAALGVLGTDSVEEVNEADATERAYRTAPAAAEAAAAAILAYDFKTLEVDQDAATRFMTEEFGAEYSETFEKVVRPAAEENRAKVTATVLASSVMRATDDTARVLLFVDQATVSRANERPQVALNRVEMSMVREGDSWLVADISSF